MADSPRQDPASSISVRALPDRGRVLCHGYIESVTYPPPSNIAAFTAIVVDHDEPQARKRGATATADSRGAKAAAPDARRTRSATAKDRLRVVWLGRRRIPGVDAGAEMRLQGMVTVRDGLPTMFNPRYEILSRQEEL